MPLHFCERRVLVLYAFPWGIELGLMPDTNKKNENQTFFNMLGQATVGLKSVQSGPKVSPKSAQSGPKVDPKPAQS